MHIFLHIGIGKTGSSSIQSVLARNRRVLADQSFLYPTTGVREEIYGTGHFDLTPLDATGITGELARLYDGLDNELAASGAERAIISSEFLAFACEGFIADLARRLDGHDVQVVFYGREQCSLIESTYLWWQKIGYDYLGDIRAFYQAHQASFELHARVLPWARAFGVENILCRLYDRAFMGGNVVDDFMKVLALRLDTAALQSAENPSLPACLSNLVCELDLLRPNGAKRAAVIDKLLDLAVDIPAGQKGRLIDDAMCEEIKKYYFESNNTFAQFFLAEPARSVFLRSITPANAEPAHPVN